MAGYGWLSDRENQNVVYELSSRAVSDLRPDELPFLEGIFPNYMELAQEGEVVVDKLRPFAFTDPDTFLTQWLVAVIIEFLNQLLMTYGPLIWHFLKGKPPPPGGLSLEASTIREHIRLSLIEIGLSDSDRLKVEDCVINAVLLMIAR